MARASKEKLMATLPTHYSPDFMANLDMRTILGRAVVDRYTIIVSDLGGDSNLSSIKHSLVRRFVWFETMIEGMECRAAAGEGVDVGAWTQLVNSWLGLARMLGLERRARRMPDLQEYLRRPSQPQEVAQ